MSHLSEEQFAHFRKRLEQQRDKLQEDVRKELMAADSERYVDIAGMVHDPGEESVADLLSDMNVALVDRQIKELRKVETALQRIAVRSYGTCEDCGGEIEVNRLESYPTATRCLDCQERYEKGYAQSSGQPTL